MKSRTEIENYDVLLACSQRRQGYERRPDAPSWLQAAQSSWLWPSSPWLWS
jgi:hypothetical protein